MMMRRDLNCFCVIRSEHLVSLECPERTQETSKRCLAGGVDGTVYTAQNVHDFISYFSDLSATAELMLYS